MYAVLVSGYISVLHTHQSVAVGGFGLASGIQNQGLTEGSIYQGVDQSWYFTS